MKNFVICSDDLGDVLTLLWEQYEEKNAVICVNPAAQQIIISVNGTQEAVIGVVELSDKYDIKQSLFSTTK